MSLTMRRISRFVADTGAHAALGVATIMAFAGSASAFVFTGANTTDPSTFGTLLQELDGVNDGTGEADSIPDSGYTWDPSSGHLGTLGGVVFQDQTEIVSRVYRVDTATTVGDPGTATIDLDPGDLVFSYTIEIVGAGANIVNDVSFVEITGLEGLVIPTLSVGQDPLLVEAVKGSGFRQFTANDPIDSNIDGNTTNTFLIGGDVDFEWTASSGFLNTGDTIELLIFTEPTAIGQGVAEFLLPPAAQNGSNVTGNDAPPVLIPIVPAPGAAALIALAGAATLRRRRAR